MRTSSNSMFAILTISAALLAANSASAGWSVGVGGGGGNKGGSGFKVTFNSGNHSNFNHVHDCHHKVYPVYHYPVKKYYEPTYVVYDQCYHPSSSFCFVFPGDTWYTIAKRCYGHSYLWKHIALYNHLSLSSSVLVPGQQILLPVVNADGTLAASNAPAPAPFAVQGAPFGPQGAPLGAQGTALGPQTQSIMPQSGATAPIIGAPQAEFTEPAAPAASIRTISTERQRPAVTLGSTLNLDGQSLGSAKGIVRLRISGMAMPVEVLDWSDSSVKIKLPAMEVAEAIAAELEVLRADGSLASKTVIELTPAATRLALGN